MGHTWLLRLSDSCLDFRLPDETGLSGCLQSIWPPMVNIIADGCHNPLWACHGGIFSSLIHMSILIYSFFSVKTLGQLVSLLYSMLMSFTFSQVSWFQVSFFVELNRAMNYRLYGDVENFARILGVCRRIFGWNVWKFSKELSGILLAFFP